MIVIYMQMSRIRKLLLSPLLLSVLVHLLLLIYFTFFIILRPEQKRPSQNSPVPAYVYKNVVPPQVHRQRASKKIVKKAVIQNTQTASTLKQIDSSMPESKETPKHKSILTSSLEMLSKNQFHEMSAALQDSEPIYLVGEETGFSDPFIMLLGKALSAYFEYPKMAGELGIKGTVLISLTLHPEGYFSNVQIKKSSNNRDLDAAALYAVNQAPIMKGMDRFIKQPKHFVVGYIFR